jgi:hypothetical protein
MVMLHEETSNCALTGIRPGTIWVAVPPLFATDAGTVTVDMLAETMPHVPHGVCDAGQANVQIPAALHGSLVGFPP